MLVVFAIILSIISQVRFARQYSGYDSVKKTISELGEVGSPIRLAVSWQFFFPFGVLFLIEFTRLYLHHALPPLVYLLFLAFPMAYIISVFFPCDEGAPVVGSLRNWVHMIFGSFEFIAPPIGMLLLTYKERYFGDNTFVLISITSAAALSLLFFLAVFIRPLKSYEGLLQRLAEIMMLLLFAYLSFYCQLST